jgi:serine/threonine protein kinase
VWRLAGGLAEALQAIHAHGLIHRDLKPGNILVAADGPRVIDFGISRTTEGTVVTATHTAIGTPAYMSPEQAQGHPVGPASDVFSLGSVLAFAAGGAAPFGGGGTEMFAIAYRVVNGEPDLSRVPASLRPVISACLAKDPAGRPAVNELILQVAVGAAAHPQITPGKFWPDEVSALLESSTFMPVLPPPAPLTPPPQRSPATDVAAGAQYAPTEAAVARQYAPRPNGAYLEVEIPAAVTRLQRAPRWLLPAALAVAVAIGAVIAIVLALSSPPKPPSFLDTNSPTSTATHG